MQLDMQTMSAVNITVTAVLGGMLLFTWARERESSFIGWWGLALLIMSVGVIMTAFPVGPPVNLLHLGMATIVLSDAIKWKAAREFSFGRARLAWILLGPVAFLVALQAGYLQSFDHEFGALSAILAVYNFAAAAALASVTDEQLPSRKPAVILLVVIALLYLSWLPLNLLMPIGAAHWVAMSVWFPGIILVTLLLRIALAFTVLSMAKERQELEQRVNALTDALTGLPNRRALFEVADALGQSRQIGDAAISVLIFDIDHFKETNDRFGHALGDRVLKLFAAIASARLNGTCLIARLGGEEFAAILPGTSPAEAFTAAEDVRNRFANSAAFVDGLPVGATVSVGVASDAGIKGDLNGLFRRADAALYVAKRAGRDRVEILGSDEADELAEVEAAVRSAMRKPWLTEPDPFPSKLRA
jgi:diguanylate cyclase (GGDEF)-like protein